MKGLQDVFPITGIEPACDLLASLVSIARSDDPLAPITVVVPSNFAGLQLRRQLAAGPGGLVNVRFLVLPRLAELVGAPALTVAGRRPLTPWLKHAAIRSALDAHRGSFEAVASHPATTLSLAATFSDLRRAPEGAAGELVRGGGRGAEVSSLFEHFRALTSHMYDAEDLASAAAEAVARGDAALRDVGEVIFFLPRALSPAQLRLFQALRDRGCGQLILGLTGEAQLDREAEDLLVRLGFTTRPLSPPTAGPAGSIRVAMAVDFEEEARLIVRLVAQALRGGTALHRIAVFHALPEYGPLLREQFASAGVPSNGTAERTLAQSVTGRTILGLYGLASPGAEAFRRESVMRWLTQAPILEPVGRSRHLAPAATWEAISRKAGITGGERQWQRRLEAWLDRPPRSGGPADWERAFGERLCDFIAGLAADLQYLPAGATAADHARHALALLERYLGTETTAGNWHAGANGGKDTELEAYRAIRRLVEEIGRTSGEASRLDFIARLAPPEARAAFAEGLSALLERPGATMGRFGEGVFVAPLSAARGMTFDVVFVAGMAEGALPPGNREDPLLPDELREAAQVPSRDGRRDEARRDYLAARDAAPHSILSFARSASGQRGQQLPSRWLLAEARLLAGRAISSEELVALNPSDQPWLIAPASFEAALADASLEPASTQEYELRSLLRSRRPIFDHWLAADAAFRSALAVAAGRLPRWLVRQPAPSTPADGLIGPDPRIAPWIGDASAQPATTSPTDLEAFAECPYRYFLRRVLHIDETELPEDRLGLDPRERGNIIHACLDRFFREAAPHAPADRWTPGERARLQAIANEQFAGTEDAGLAGPDLMWQADQDRMRRDLDLFLTKDEAERRALGATFEHGEQRFGRPRSDDEPCWPPAEITLQDGRRILFSGQVDRVDRTADGFAVYDYKTGRTTGFTDIQKGAPGDRLVRGKKIQLPLYALALRQAKALPAASPVDASYWFVSEAENFQRIGYRVDDAIGRRFHEVIETVAASIEAGVFPQAAGKDTWGKPQNCRYCPYDRICPGNNRNERWNALAEDPAVARLGALLNGTEEAAGD